MSILSTRQSGLLSFVRYAWTRHNDIPPSDPHSGDIGSTPSDLH